MPRISTFPGQSKNGTRCRWGLSAPEGYFIFLTLRSVTHTKGHVYQLKYIPEKKRPPPKKVLELIPPIGLVT